MARLVRFGMLAAAFTLGLASSAAAQDSVAGDWDVTLETPQGANTVTLSLKQDTDKLTGELGSPMGAVPVTGTFTAGTLALTANIDIQGMQLALGFTGKVAGESMTGSVKMGDFGEFPFTGKKKPAGAAAAAAPAAAAPAPAAGAAPAGGIDGAWDVILSIPGAGDVPASATFKLEGDAVTGVLSSPAGEVPIKGTFAGNALKLEFSAETPQGPIAVTMNGVMSATGLAGKASIAGLGEADWKATRK